MRTGGYATGVTLHNDRRLMRGGFRNERARQATTARLRSTPRSFGSCSRRARHRRCPCPPRPAVHRGHLRRAPSRRRRQRCRCSSKRPRRRRHQSPRRRHKRRSYRCWSGCRRRRRCTRRRRAEARPRRRLAGTRRSACTGEGGRARAEAAGERVAPAFASGAAALPALDAFAVRVGREPVKTRDQVSSSCGESDERSRPPRSRRLR